MKTENYHIAFVNLDHRLDRLEKMSVQLDRLKIPAARLRGMYAREYNGNFNVEKMRRRTPGAIGCYLSQLRIMKEAQAFGKHAIVMEDDLHFCEDFHERFEVIEQWLETHDWDVFYLGASFHCNPPWWHKKGHRERELDVCDCNLQRDAECTDNHHVMRVYGAFATFAYIVNVNSLEKVIKELENIIPLSIGIDWSMIALGTKLKQFCFVPGLVRQIDNMSDIGSGETIWSGFLKLNGTHENSSYVYQEKMSDFDPTTFNWAEAHKR